MATFPELLRPLKLGRYTLRNRIIMAPLTRCQATEDGHVPRTESMLKYYEDRASAGLIIAEATMVQPNYTGFLTEPGIYSDAQIESGERSWMRYTKRVALYSCNSFTLVEPGFRRRSFSSRRVTRIPLLGACLPRVPFPLRTIGFLPILLRAGKRRPTVSQRSSRMTKSGTVSSHCLWRGPKRPFLRLGLMALRFMEPTATYWTLFFANLPTSASPVRTPERPSTHDANSSTMSPKASAMPWEVTAWGSASPH
ncbi:prostaglandin F2alpha synthase [Trypanosoma cruzi]|uniref:Prostaglandin F2alpha synthase n=1 Tax=Trypanosoma cruzi TaxID=5693 RepID=A0A2V2ULA2_TRYCR|nr:prostaglandin F2alpha synthase [Trypanosoma cruzi]